MPYTFPTADKTTILEWKKAFGDTVHDHALRITRIPSDHEQEPLFDAFCQALSHEIPRITVRIDSDKKELPALTLGENITLNTIPQGKIFTSFLKVLSWLYVDTITNKKNGTTSPPTALSSLPLISSKTAKHLSAMEVPVSVKLYIANTCPHCPGVLETILSLCVASPHIHLTVFDGTIFPDVAAKDNVLAAPCLILDDFRWTGSVTAEEVTGMMLNRDPSALSTASLRMILEDGKADWIAREMEKKKQIFPGFIGLVTHKIWSVRLGAMVVIEELAETTPELTRSMAPALLKAFDGADIPTQGDILYALGEVGDDAVKKSILNMMAGLENPDLKEAAEEAIESIENRGE